MRSVAYSPREAVPLLGVGSSSAAEHHVAGGDRGDFWETAHQHASTAQLGTFLGVIVPCLANIFGLTIFVRVPFIVGQAGLVWALGLYTVSVIVTLLTLCSICALVTNGHIGSGGAYFIISRSLGPEFGGAIGVVFYFANLIGVTAYCNVMTTQLKDALAKPQIFVDHRGVDDYILYTLFLSFFTATAMAGAKVVARASVVIMALVLAALYLAMLSFIARPAGLGTHVPGGSVVGPGGDVHSPTGEYDWFTGWSSDTLHANLGTGFQKFRGDEFSISVIFGIIFPSCTGVMSGVNMSGDLKDPQSSIPIGTAVGYAFAITHIFVLIILLAGTTRRHELIERTDTIMSELCYSRILVLLGLLAAVVSSAISNMAAAPRLLQAMGQDRLVPFLRPFAQGKGPTNEPHRATVISALIVAVLNSMSDLNVILTVTTMFYLQCYAITNLACFALRIAATPNFRPTFQYFGKGSALLGFLCCLSCMFIIDSNMAGISWILTCVLFVAIHVTTPPQHWGEVTQALLYHQVRKLLLRLDGSRRHVRNWRPQLLLLMSLSDANGGDRGTECLAATLNHVKKSGLLLLAHVVPVFGRDNLEFSSVGGSGVGLSRTASSTPFDETPWTRGTIASSHGAASTTPSGGGTAPSAWTAAARSVQSRTRCDCDFYSADRAMLPLTGSAVHAICAQGFAGHDRIPRLEGIPSCSNGHVITLWCADSGLGRSRPWLACPKYCVLWVAVASRTR